MPELGIFTAGQSGTIAFHFEKSGIAQAMMDEVARYMLMGPSKSCVDTRSGCKLATTMTVAAAT